MLYSKIQLIRSRQITPGATLLPVQVYWSELSTQEIDADHPDLRNAVVDQYDFYNDTPEVLDDNGHGTHVAGIIASQGLTYRGVSFDVGLLGAKVLSANGGRIFIRRNTWDPVVCGAGSRCYQPEPWRRIIQFDLRRS